MGITVTTTATVSRIDWLGLIIACPECGAAEDLTVRAGSTPTPYTYGESADIKCSHGHAWDHPLIYPQMVHYVAAGSQPGDMGVPAWRPHLASSWLVHEGEAEQHSHVEHRPWEWFDWYDATWWQEKWPELVSAVRFGPRWFTDSCYLPRGVRLSIAW